MWQTLVLFLILFLLLIDNISASLNSSVCFFDRNEKLVEEFSGLTIQNCTIISNTNSTFGPDGCAVSCDRDFQLGSEKEEFELSIGVGRDNSNEIIVLNVTISNITFQKLRIRHQNLASGKGEIYWQTIEFKEDQIPKKLSTFSSVWESQKTKIQFFAEGSGYKFFKEYHFTSNSTIPNGDSPIFAYVDTTFQDRVYLHVQPQINTTRYIVDFQRVNEKRETLSIPPTFNIYANHLTHEQTHFPENGNYKFFLVPVDNNGKNSTPITVGTFCMQTSCETLFKMKLIFGIMTVILVSLSIMTWVCFKIKGWRKLKAKPRLLLISSCTHDAHIEVMVNLARHLEESCEVIPMLNVLDIPRHVHKNPSYWYDSAFQKADIVVVVSSPECKNFITKSIYDPQCLDNYAKILIQADRAYSKKKYYFALVLPYCTELDLPEEAKTFERLEIKDLKKLVHRIYKTKYPKVKKDTDDELQLIESIESAKRSIRLEEPNNQPKNLENSTDTAISRIEETVTDVDQRHESCENNTPSTSDDSRADRIEYGTNIESLCLLGNVKAQ